MKNVILYLIRATPKDISLFIESLNSISVNLTPYINNFDILCLHEPQFDIFKQQINDLSPLPILFHEISGFTTLPDHYNGVSIVPDYRGYGLGYRHMCRFYSGEIFKLDILKQYKYYLRLDNDSSFPKQVARNLFQEMEDHDAYYGYIENTIRVDPDWCAEGIQQIANEFIKTSGVETCIPAGSIKENHIYYNNFEICNIEWFSRGVYQDYFNYVDRSHKIMTNRFGDALVRYFGVNYFMPQKRVKSFRICYKHYSEINC